MPASAYGGTAYAGSPYAGGSSTPGTTLNLSLSIAAAAMQTDILLLQGGNTLLALGLPIAATSSVAVQLSGAIPLFMPDTLAPGTTGSGSYNGLNWGPGTDYHLGSLTASGAGSSIAVLGNTGLSGMNDLPSLRTSDAPRAQEAGAWQGIDLAEPRTVRLELQIIAADNLSLYADVAIAETAFQPRQTGELPLLLFNATRQINCRVRKRSVPYDTGTKPRIGGMMVELLASDPRVYDATATSLVLIAASPAGGGAHWPAGWPMSWGGGSSGGTGTASNKGNFPSRPVVTIIGPCTNPYIQNATTGQTLAFSLVLVSGDRLVLDLDARSVVLNGTASRRASLVSGSAWWELPPGASTLTFGAATVGGGCACTVTYRSAWM